jgi:hypothetical protein
MIANCRSCHHAFWRYRRDWPPAGFCCLPCFETGPKPKEAPQDAPPAFPAAVLLEMRAHRVYAHNTTSILGWFEGCSRCEELETDYAASLEFHYRAANEQIAEEAKERWVYQISVMRRA